MDKPYKLTWDYNTPREYLGLYEKFEMPPLIISCAITGGWQGKESNPNMPETPEEQAQSTFEAYEAGASIVHVHARDPKKGYANAIGDKDIYYDINKRIRELSSDIIINNTTGGGPGMSVEEPDLNIERMQVVAHFDYIKFLDKNSKVLNSIDFSARRASSINFFFENFYSDFILFNLVI